MSIYDRADRVTNLSTNRTAPIVGPGSYDIDRPPREKVRKDGYAPFNSLSTRNINFSLDGDNPAPGQYDPLVTATQGKNVVSIKSTTERFKEKISFTPGPGTYDVKELALLDHTEVPSVKGRGSSLSKGFGADKDVLVYKNIRFERKYNVPSIPVPSQSHGYEEGVNGTLVRQAPPEKDTTIGPAFYNAQRVDLTPQSAAKYKGNHWGYMRAKRDSDTVAKKAAREVPGPGTYDIPDFTRSATDLCQGMKQELHIPRFVDSIITDAKKRGGPGPGWYQVPGEFDPKLKAPVEEGAGPVDRPPFLSSESRFRGNARQLSPGPGAYSDPRTALEALRKPTALKRQPFGQTAARFSNSRSAPGVPGPAAYNPVGDLSRESLRKAFMAASQRGGFGTSSVRQLGPAVVRDAIEAPGPGHYDPKVHITAAPRYVQMSSTFASTSKRDGDAADKDIPPPGSYDVQKAFRALRDQKAVAKPRTDDAWRRQTSFGVAASRWRSESDLRSTALPGPGSYETDIKTTGAIDPNRGRTIPHEMRFYGPKAPKQPGPAEYTLSPLLQDTVLRGTFNVTLGQAQLVK